MLLKVDEFDMTENIGSEEGEPVTGDLEAGEEVIFCEIVGDEVEDERDVKDGNGDGMFGGDELHGRRGKGSRSGGKEK